MQKSKGSLFIALNTLEKKQDFSLDLLKGEETFEFHSVFSIARKAGEFCSHYYSNNYTGPVQWDGPTASKMSIVSVYVISRYLPEEEICLEIILKD